MLDSGVALSPAPCSAESYSKALTSRSALRGGDGCRGTWGEDLHVASDIALNSVVITALCTGPGFVCRACRDCRSQHVVNAQQRMLGRILRRREKSPEGDSIWGDTSETMMSGLGIGGACSRRSVDSHAEEGLSIDGEVCEGLSGRLR